jgi:lipoprotein NlpD
MVHAPLRSLIFIALLAMCALVSGCGTQPVRKAATYTVKAGDTVYSIAWRNGVDYHDVARLNHIGRDYHISIGQVLILQRDAEPVKAVKPASVTALKPAQPAPPIQSSIRWQWPVAASNTTNSYAATTRPNGGKGLVINGIAGQDIRAAASGKVVYAGTGLLGYGQLLIIKHDEAFLSAYGHTQSLFVREGDSVNAGQKIATMGQGPDGKSQLYFEIRFNGTPLLPLSLLQQR